MKISTIRAVFTAEDVLGIIHEFVKIEGLSIDGVELNELITVTGSFKKGVTIPFKAAVGLGNVNGNVINAKIFSIKVGKIGILKGIQNFALKKFLSDFETNGISVDKDNLSVDLNEITKIVPFINFKLLSIRVEQGNVEAELQDVSFVPEKETAELGKSAESKAVHKEKIKDGYTNVRENIEKKVPGKLQNVIEYAMIVPDIIALLYRLLRDKRVNIKTKALIGGVLAYLACPIDIFPDFIPFVGKIDDVAVAFFGLDKIMNQIPQEIVLENWQGEDDIILKVKEGVNYIYNAVGGKNIAKLLDYLKFTSRKEKVKIVENSETKSIALEDIEEKNTEECNIIETNTDSGIGM